MANDTEGLSEQIRLQREYAKALEDRLKFERSLGLSSSEQARILSELNKTMDDIEFPSGKAEKFGKSLKDTGTDAQNSTEAIQKASQSTSKYGDATVKTTKKGKGFIEWLKEKKQMLLGIVDKIGEVVVGLYNFGKALFALISGQAILDKLIETAQNLPIDLSFARAREEVRQFAGDLTSGPGKAILDGYGNLRKQASSLAATGLSMTQIYGRGVQAAAAALKDINEFAEKLGPNLTLLQDQVKKSGVNFVMMARGLGITNDQMAETAKIATSLGKDPLKYSQEFATMAAKSQKAFGVSAKIMGRGMAELQNTLPHLRREGPKAFAPIVAYAQKLGLELKQVTGMLETFSSVEKGLEAASGLAQMGVYIDPLKLVAESDAAKQMDMIAKSFKSAGKSIDLADRHQRNYLKSLLGVDENTLDTIAGQNKLNKSYEDTQKQADKAAKMQMDSAEAMKILAKGIKREILDPLDTGKLEGFFDALTKGFLKGFTMSGPFRKMLYDIRAALRSVYFVGVQLGKAFVNFFPGIKEMIGGIRKLFNPKAWRGFASEIKNAFDSAMKNFDKDPQGAVKKFLERIQKAFFKWSKSTGNFWLNILPGLKKFTKAAGEIAGGIIRYLAEGLANGIKSLAKMITEGIGGSDSGVTSEIGEIFKNLFAPAWKAIKESWPQIKEAFIALWDAAYPVIKEQVLKVLSWIKDNVIDPLDKKLGELFGFKDVQGNMMTFSDKIAEVWNQDVKPIFDSIVEYFSEGGEGRAWIEKIMSFLKNASVEIPAAFDSLWTGIKRWWEDNKPEIEAIGTLVAAAFLSFVPFVGPFLAGFTLVVGELKAGWDKIKNWWNKTEVETQRLVEDTRKNQEKLMKEGVSDDLKVTSGLYKKALAEGKMDDALSYRAQMEALKAGFYDRGSDEFKSFKEKKRVELAAQVSKEMQEAVTKASEEASKNYAENARKAAEAAAKEQEKKQEEVTKSVSKARSLAELIQDLKDTEEKIKSAETELDGLLKRGNLKEKIKTVVEKLGGILPIVIEEMNKLKDINFQIDPKVESDIGKFGVFFDSFDNALEKVKNFSLGPKITKTILGGIERFGDIIVKLNNISIAENLVKLGKNVEAFAQSIDTAGGVLVKNEANYAKLAGISKSFTGGQLTVNHNLPNTKIEVFVTLDSKKLGSELFKADLGVAKKPYYFKNSGTKPPEIPTK